MEDGTHQALPSFNRLLSFEFGELSLEDGEAGDQQRQQQERQQEQPQEQRLADHGYDVLVRAAGWRLPGILRSRFLQPYQTLRDGTAVSDQLVTPAAQVGAPTCATQLPPPGNRRCA